MAIPVISFFTGGGFMDIGFEQAGFKVAWTNEDDSTFADLYEFGMNSLHKANEKKESITISDRRSIDEIKSEDILISAFGSEPPELFGVIGGPPCQDFSISGKIEGFNGSRGKLTKVFFKKICELSPTFFVMENVAGLWRIKKNKKKLDQILNIVKEKYHVVDNILNAIEYGVPQDRERLFLVGIKKSDIKENDYQSEMFLWPEPPFKDALTKYAWPVKSKYKGKPRKPRNIPKELCVQSCLVSENNKRIANANEVFKAYSDKFHYIEEGDTRTQSFKRLHRNKYSPTACYGNNEVHLHPYLPRRLSVREALKIQGVPDDYKLPPKIGPNKKHTGLTAKYKMIGNGVPVPLAWYIAESIYQLLENRNMI